MVEDVVCLRSTNTSEGRGSGMRERRVRLCNQARWGTCSIDFKKI